MASTLRLPSGRDLELQTLTYGDLRDAEDAQFDSGKTRLFVYFDRLMSALSGLSIEEIRALAPQDGEALFAAARAATANEGGKPDVR